MKFPDLTRRLHVSWLIAWLSSGILLGVLLSSFVHPLDPIQGLLIALALSFVAFRIRAVWVIALLLLAGLALGAGRGGVLQQDLTGYQVFYGKTVSLGGVIAEDTTIGPKGDQRVRLKNVTVDGISLPGEVWVSANSQLELKRSDNVAFRGQLSEGFGNLPASMFRAQLTEADRPHFADVPRDVRDRFADSVRTAVPEPEASLGVGYLTGQRSTLPEDLNEELQLLGLTHVVVASGYNLTILVRFSRRVFAKRSKYLAALSASTMIISFVLITGFSPSMSRAALVAGISLLAWYFGRNTQPLVILSFSAAVTALINPAFVWGDIGWYLSFTSFAGVMVLAPLITHYFWGVVSQPGVFGRIVIETMSAQLATLPIIAFIFGQYSPLALPANLLILPLIPLTMVCTFAAGLAGLLLPGIASVFGLPATLLLSYMTTATGRLADLPWAQGMVKFGVPALIGGYVLLLLVGLVLWRKTKHNFGKDNIVV